MNERKFWIILGIMIVATFVVEAIIRTVLGGQNMEDFIKKMIEAADATGKELKVEISKEKESYRITPKKELRIKFTSDNSLELTIEGLNVVDMTIAIHTLTKSLAERTGDDAMYIYAALIQTYREFVNGIDKEV